MVSAHAQWGNSRAHAGPVLAVFCIEVSIYKLFIKQFIFISFAIFLVKPFQQMKIWTSVRPDAGPGKIPGVDEKVAGKIFCIREQMGNFCRY